VPASVVQEGNGNTPAGSAVHVGHCGCKNGVFLRLEKIECRALLTGNYQNSYCESVGLLVVFTLAWGWNLPEYHLQEVSTISGFQPASFVAVNLVWWF